MTDVPDEMEVPDDAGEYADPLEAILRRIPEHWGRRLSVDAGWYPIIARLDQQLAALDPGYELHQVKEKFGGLRYYTETHLQGSEYEQFRALVDAAEAEAGRTCERCGRPGRAHIRRTTVRTFCPTCADDMSDEKTRYEPVQHPEDDDD